MKIVIILFLLLLPLQASPIPEFPFIAVRGEAAKEVPPTSAEIRCTVLCHSKSAEEATLSVNDVLKSLLIEVGKLGINAKDIEAHDLEKSAVRARTRDGDNQEIVGYDVSRRVVFQIVELKQYPDIVRALMKADNVTEISSSFRSDKEEEARAKLLEDACARAKSKAELLAKATGRTISGVHAVSDNGFGLLEERFIPNNLGSPLSARFDIDRLKDAPIFVPGYIKYDAVVNILYTTVELKNR